MKEHLNNLVFIELTMDTFIRDFLYEKMLASYVQFEVAEIEKEIEIKKELISRLKRGAFIKYDENSVSDVNEQKLIMYDMYRKLDKDKFEAFSDRCPSMFVSADNVRYCYKENNMEMPLWFSEKYGHIYNKK